MMCPLWNSYICVPGPKPSPTALPAGPNAGEEQKMYMYVMVEFNAEDHSLNYGAIEIDDGEVAGH